MPPETKPDDILKMRRVFPRAGDFVGVIGSMFGRQGLQASCGVQHGAKGRHDAAEPSTVNRTTVASYVATGKDSRQMATSCRRDELLRRCDSNPQPVGVSSKAYETLTVEAFAKFAPVESSHQDQESPTTHLKPPPIRLNTGQP